MAEAHVEGALFRGHAVVRGGETRWGWRREVPCQCTRSRSWPPHVQSSPLFKFLSSSSSQSVAVRRDSGVPSKAVLCDDCGKLRLALAFRVSNAKKVWPFSSPAKVRRCQVQLLRPRLASCGLIHLIHVSLRGVQFLLPGEPRSQQPAFTPTTPAAVLAVSPAIPDLIFLSSSIVETPLCFVTCHPFPSAHLVVAAPCSSDTHTWTRQHHLRILHQASSHGFGHAQSYDPSPFSSPGAWLPCCGGVYPELLSGSGRVLRPTPSQS